MALPKLLSPSFWIDKCLTLVLQLTLALLLQTLYVLKGEDVILTDVKVTVRKSISSDDSRSKTNSPPKSTKQTQSKQDNLKAGPTSKNNKTTVTATKATSNSQGDSTHPPKVPSVTSKESKKTIEKAIVTGTLTELKPDNLEKQILLEGNNVATPIENEAVTPIENEIVKINDDESPKTISFEKIIEEIKEDSVNVEEIKEESATVEEIKEESATVEEIKEESATVEEIEESVTVEEIKAESATVEEIKEESATVEEIKEESAT
ncbi:3018_t:CDS:1, partial [Ambispora gerdemannii]